MGAIPRDAMKRMEQNLSNDGLSATVEAGDEAGTVDVTVDGIESDAIDMSAEADGETKITHTVDVDMSEERTNDDVSGVPSGEWDDYDGPRDVFEETLQSHERVNESGETESRTNMAGVPSDVTRDASSLGESQEDLSDVPAGEWDDVPSTHGQVARTNDSDDVSGVPAGEWRTNDSMAERFGNASSDAMTVHGRLNEEWTYRHEVTRTNDGMSQWDYTKALKELARAGLAEKDGGRKPYRYRTV